MSTSLNNLVCGSALRFSLAICLAAFVSNSADAGVLYSDDFTAADGAYTATTTTPTKDPSIPNLEPYGGTINAEITSNELTLNDGSNSPHEGLSFGGAAGRFNWATAPFAQSILDNGLQIKFDVNAPHGSDYISLGFGSFTGVPDGGAGFGAIYDSSDMDWGYRAENDRMISFLADGTTTPSYRTDQQPGGYNVGNGNWYHVELDLQFTDFNAGSTVTASSFIYDGQGTSGTLVSNLPNFDTFTLGATDNFVFDFSSNQNQSGAKVRVDNLVICSGAVPEPASLALLGLGGLALIGGRRRA